MKRIITLLLLLLLAAGLLFAQEITEIRVSGLRKTNESFITDNLSSYIGKDEKSVDVKAIETALRSSNLFTNIRIEVKDGVIEIHLEEKLSFIPLPFVSFSSSSLYGGLMLLNMNAFGKGGTLVAGGFFSDSSASVMSMYSIPGKSLKKPGYSLSSSFSIAETSFVNLEDVEYYSVENTRFSLGGSLNFPINKTVYTSVGTGYRQYFTDSKDLGMGNLSFTIGYNKPSFDGYFLSSNSLKASCSIGLDTDGEFSENVELSTYLMHTIVPGLRAIGNLSAEYTHNRDLLLSPAGLRSSILPSGVVTDRFVEGSATLEKAYKKDKTKTVSGYAMYDAVYLNDNFDDELHFQQGVGVGMRIYLEKVAFPALALGLVYNITEDRMEVNGSLGISY